MKLAKNAFYNEDILAEVRNRKAEDNTTEQKEKQQIPLLIR